MLTAKSLPLYRKQASTSLHVSAMHASPVAPGRHSARIMHVHTNFTCKLARMMDIFMASVDTRQLAAAATQTHTRGYNEMHWRTTTIEKEKADGVYVDNWALPQYELRSYSTQHNFCPLQKVFRKPHSSLIQRLLWCFVLCILVAKLFGIVYHSNSLSLSLSGSGSGCLSLTPFTPLLSSIRIHKDKMCAADSFVIYATW